MVRPKPSGSRDSSRKKPPKARPDIRSGSTRTDNHRSVWTLGYPPRRKARRHCRRCRLAAMRAAGPSARPHLPIQSVVSLQWHSGHSDTCRPAPHFPPTRSARRSQRATRCTGQRSGRTHAARRKQWCALRCFRAAAHSVPPSHRRTPREAPLSACANRSLRISALHSSADGESSTSDDSH